MPPVLALSVPARPVIAPLFVKTPEPLIVMPPVVPLNAIVPAFMSPVLIPVPPRVSVRSPAKVSVAPLFSLRELMLRLLLVLILG